MKNKICDNYLSNSYKTIPTMVRFFIMNELIKILRRQRKKRNVLRAVRKFKTEFYSTHRYELVINNTSAQGLSNLLTNHLQKFTEEEIIDIYEKKYREQYEKMYETRTTITITTPVDEKEDSGISSICTELVAIRQLLEQFASTSQVLTVSSQKKLERKKREAFHLCK